MIEQFDQVHILKLRSPFMILQIKIKLIFMLVIIETAYVRKLLKKINKVFKTCSRWFCYLEQIKTRLQYFKKHKKEKLYLPKQVTYTVLQLNRLQTGVAMQLRSSMTFMYFGCKVSSFYRVRKVSSASILTSVAFD